MRAIITGVLGLILLAGSLYVAKRMIDNKKSFRPPPTRVLTSVFVDSVKNADIPITITSSGNLMAKNRLELYAEVQGIFVGSDREFKPGMWYTKGSILIHINSDEHEANQRSSHNYVTVGPREIIMSASAPITQAFYERHGIICHTVEVGELRKAAGAVGCLTGILQRELVS